MLHWAAHYILYSGLLHLFYSNIILLFINHVITLFGGFKSLLNFEYNVEDKVPIWHLSCLYLPLMTSWPSLDFEHSQSSFIRNLARFSCSQSEVDPPSRDNLSTDENPDICHVMRLQLLQTLQNHTSTVSQKPRQGSCPLLSSNHCHASQHLSHWLLRVTWPPPLRPDWSVTITWQKPYHLIGSSREANLLLASDYCRTAGLLEL